MPKSIKINGVDRIIDANINRAKEGLRVCEEIARFILKDRYFTVHFKNLRHKISLEANQLITLSGRLKERESLRDVGRAISSISELKRKNCQEIFFSNIGRVKEAIRVLEEFSKLKNIKSSLRFKKLRFSLYELEKKSLRKITALCRLR